jgi:CubicO group peptidase (beta-lactamase class C family)
MSEHLSRRQALKLSAASLAALGSIQPPAPADEMSLVTGRAASPTDGHIETSRLHHTINGLLESSGLPGLSVAIIDNGWIAAYQGFGYANRRTRQPVTEKTVFQAASLTKPTFAYLVLRLCEEGKLSLDAPLTQTYLPDLVPSISPGAERITARSVLAHMSGLPITHFPKWPEKMNFAPGERFSYSGAAYIYLQRVVEKVLGMPLLNAMDDYVLRPLGLADSAYVWRSEYETEAAVAYDFDNTPIREVDRSRPEQANAAGSLHTTPKDYAKFLVELLFRKEGALSLDYTLKRMMLSPQVRLTDRLAWGLGWGLRLSEDGDRFWHWGDSRGYMSYAVGSPALRRGVVILTNGRNGLRVAEQVAAKVMGDAESETFAWIYDGFYVKNEVPIPPLPTDGGTAPPPPPAAKAHRLAGKPPRMR